MAAQLRAYLRGLGRLRRCKSPADFDALVQAAEKDAPARLRWKTGRALGMPLRQLRRCDYLFALAQLELDRKEAEAALCPACRAAAAQRLCPGCGAPLPEYGASFDPARYEALKHHGKGV